MHQVPSLSDQQVTLLLRQARADGDPAVAWLRARLARNDAQAWIGHLAERADGLATGGGAAQNLAEETTVVDAVRRARAWAAGDTTALRGVDVEVLDRIWETLAEAAADPVAADCRTACLLLERDLTAVGGAQPLVRVGRFLIEGVIGAGGSGTVYRASHVDNGQAAAVKVLHAGLVDAEIAVRFRNEARIAGRLCHPAIVRLLDSGVQECAGTALPYVAYEFIEGALFHHALAGKPVASILRTFAQLCDGVQHAHDANVLHRDLKPANVLVDAAGNPRVLDFGIACSLVAASDHGFRTLAGQVLGTPGFMSPEQANGQKVDVRGDVFSLGAMLFFALTGQTPHDVGGLGVAEALSRVASQEPRRVRALRPELDRDLAAVVDKAIARDLRLRYASVADLVRDVRRLCAGDPVDARPPSTWQSFRQLMRRHRVGSIVALTIFATAAVGGAVAAVLWQQAARAEARVVHLSAEALAAATGGIDMAARLAETTAAAAEQLKLVQPMLDAVTGLRPVTGDDVPKWRSVESRLREVAGDLLQRRGDLAAAHEQRALVLAIEDELAVAGCGQPSVRARAMVKLGDLDLSPMRTEAGRLYEQAHAIFAALAAAPDAPIEALDDYSWSFHRLAGIARQQERGADAAVLARQHLEQAKVLLARSPDGLRNFQFATATLLLRTCERRDRSASDVDLEELTAATTAAEAAVAADPDRRTFLIAAFQCHNALARLHLACGHARQALPPAERAATLAQSLRVGDGDAEVLGVRSAAVLGLADVATALATAPPPDRDCAAAQRALTCAETRFGDDMEPWVAQATDAARAALLVALSAAR